MVVVAVATQMKKPHESQGLPIVNFLFRLLFHNIGLLTLVEITKTTVQGIVVVATIQQDPFLCQYHLHTFVC
jgi:hypothetical protein